MDVPLIVAAAAEEVIQADVIPAPGAKMSTQDPQLEKAERAPSLFMDATVIAVGAEAGEVVHASTFSLPAATTVTKPLAVI